MSAPEPMEVDVTPAPQNTTTTTTTEIPLNEQKVEFETESPALAEENLHNFLHEIEVAETNLEVITSDLESAQQTLLKEFVMKSLQLMQRHNALLKPIHNKLSTIKQPLCQILLNKCVSIPCDKLEKLASQKNPYTKKWGVSSSTYAYNKKENKFQYFDLGVPTLSSSSNAQSTSTTNTNTNTDINIDTTAAATTTTTTTTNTQPSTQSDQSEAKEKMDIEEEVQFENPESISKEQIDMVLKHVNDIRNKEKREENMLAAKQRQAELKIQKAQERQTGAVSVTQIVPWLTLEQATTLLEMKDNVQQVIEYCTSTDPTQIYSDIANFKNKKPNSKSTSPAPAGGDSSNSLSKLGSTGKTLPKSGSFFGARSNVDKRVLNRSQTDGRPKSVILRVTEVDDDGSVALRGVLDRNLIPLDPQHAQILRLSLKDLMEVNMQFVDEETVQFYCQSNILKVVFQIVRTQDPQQALQNQLLDAASQFGYGDMAQAAIHASGYDRHSRDQIEFIPISLVPKVREMEYKFDFNSQENEANPLGNQSLKSVSHVMDGSVLFEGKYDDGSLGLVGSMASVSPVELYTQILDDETHNVVMMLIDDIRDDISIEVKNLTHVTGLTLEDCMNEFGRDASGRKLCYRIVVKDSQVIGVLAPLGDEIKQIPFLEHPVPSEGQLVKIQNGDRVGIVKNIPTGLIVTNNPKDDFEKKDLKFPREESLIFRKHVADLHGFIDCEVVYENGEWLLEKPDYKAFNVTELEVANEEVETEYFHIRESLQSEVTNDFMGLLESVDNIVSRLRAKSYSDSNESKNALKEATETLQNVKTMRGVLVDKHQGPEVDPQIATILSESQAKIAALERELRALRFEVNMT